MENDRLKTAVVGAGYVGIATAVGFAEQGRNIVLVERDPDRLTALANGRIPFHEPGLPEAYASQHAARRIVPSATIPGDGLDLIVVCVGTPIDDTGSTNVSQVARALEQVAPAIAAGAACVIRSTLPVGSAARLANRPGVVPERLFVAPEFLRQGSALEDIRKPTRVVVGTVGEPPGPGRARAGDRRTRATRNAVPRDAGRRGEPGEERLERLPGPAPHVRERGGRARGGPGRGCGTGARGDRA